MCFSPSPYSDDYASGCIDKFVHDFHSELTAWTPKQFQDQVLTHTMYMYMCGMDCNSLPYNQPITISTYTVMCPHWSVVVGTNHL